MATPNYEQMREMFRAHTEAAVKTIVDIMSGSGGKGDAVRLSAAKEVLTRGWGKPGGQEKKEKEPKLAPKDNPAYRGKALTQIVAEEAAAEGRDPPWGKAVPAERPAEPEPSEPPARAPSAPPAAAAASVSPPLPQSVVAAAARADDPTGYKARRALWSAPTPK